MLASDNELLGRHLFGDDSLAFEELVRRHSALVMSVCRNMLLHHEDAEDAFQATFLVLSRKAEVLVKRNSIAGWLYQVALRNCLEIRRRNGRKREETMVTEPHTAENEPWLTITQAQDCDLIYQEINRLPKNYRDAIVTCHMQGHSRSEAAELLNWTEAAVKAALSRGRNLLRKRLVRKGIMTTGMLTLLQTTSVKAQQAVSETLITATLQTCSGTAQTCLPGSDPNFVHSIAQHGATSMSNSIVLKTVTACIGLAIISCVPLLVIAQQTGKQKTDPLVVDQNEGEVAQAKSVSVAVADLRSLDTNDEQAETKGGASDDASQAGPFSVNDSIEYWELMMRSHEIKQASLDQAIANQKRLRNRGLSAENNELAMQSENYVLKAKILEAKINIDRIRRQQKHGIAIDPASIPPASTVSVRPGEALVVESSTDSSINRRVVVQADHTIALPLVGTVQVKGLTPQRIRKTVEEKYRTFLNEPSIFVSRENSSRPLEK